MKSGFQYFFTFADGAIFCVNTLYIHKYIWSELDEWKELHLKKDYWKHLHTSLDSDPVPVSVPGTWIPDPDPDPRRKCVQKPLQKLFTGEKIKDYD